MIKHNTNGIMTHISNGKYTKNNLVITKMLFDDSFKPNKYF
jgi:hypothetical protein